MEGRGYPYVTFEQKAVRIAVFFLNSFFISMAT